MHETVLPIADHARKFCGREADDRHTDRHRFDDRETEARPADRIGKESVACTESGKLQIADMPTRSSGTRMRVSLRAVP
jgi:hypothetical protein